MKDNAFLQVLDVRSYRDLSDTAYILGLSFSSWASSRTQLFFIPVDENENGL